MLEERIQKILKGKFDRTIEDCTDIQIYFGLLQLVKELMSDGEQNDGEKKLYYISAEFLVGKLLSNNMINLGIFEDVKNILAGHGKDIYRIEEAEPEPSLGNGGLGRLAACFMDSIATLGLPGDGIGLNYHLGLFRQEFDEHKQKEMPDPWIEDEGWLEKTDVQFRVPFGNFEMVSTMYDVGVTGYNSRMNKLHLFDVNTVDEKIVESGISFDKERIGKNLTLFLYPDDSDEAGRKLRVYQQYFMVSNAAQYIIEEYKEKGYDLEEMPDHVVVQINDTHPSLIIPELIRLLCDEGIAMEKAVDIVSRMCAYTNHTILAEALEKWPLEYLHEVVPHLVPIIRRLDEMVKEKYEDAALYIIDEDDLVHMAHMDIHYCFSVNGVAALHTEILKSSELKAFYGVYPEKFNNKTNGITFRRWLMHCNPLLTRYITGLIGNGYKEDAQKLKELERFKEDKRVLQTLQEIKQENKRELRDYLKREQNIELDENSIFDIQIKRMHEYKRQQMNALYIIYKYLEIKQGNFPKIPLTIIFGGKAAPAYTIAKDIIHLILCLAQLIENDPKVRPYLNIVMVENYDVTLASKLIPACDVSEQISLASKEASGTGNMKLMLNGAVTLGTMDGANVEIFDLVGEENIYIFGESSDGVIERYEKGDYSSKKIYSSDSQIKEWVDFITSDKMLQIGCQENLMRLHKELVAKDWFMTLLDVKDYIRVKDKMFEDFEDQDLWNRKMLMNISRAGYFSSDRTIREYNEEIWKLKKL